MEKIVLKKIPSKEIMPGFSGRLVHSANMTFAHWDIKAGAPLPSHSHAHEQVVNVIEGEFELTVNGESHLLQANDVFIIPSDAIHSGKAITDCKIIDVFYPVREDYR